MGVEKTEKNNPNSKIIEGAMYLSRTNFPSLYFWVLSCAISWEVKIEGCGQCEIEMILITEADA